MLQNGAKKVYAVDVGYGQFAWKLRQDERVVCMEKTNIRYVTPENIDDELDFASVDVSFISLTKVLGPARALLKDGGEMVCLIKPQFEAGREKVGKKGVVRDKSVHEEVVSNIISFALSNGFSVLDLEYSPIKGPEGNIEYLVHIKKTDDPIKEDSVDIHSVVEAALLLYVCHYFICKCKIPVLIGICYHNKMFHSLFPVQLSMCGLDHTMNIH